MSQATADDPRIAGLKARLGRVKTVMSWALKSEGGPRINAMLDLARSEPGVPILPAQLDCDPWLFNCMNGTLELKTGLLREHRPGDYITKLCPVEYHPSAPCERWLQFIGEIFEEKTNLIGYVKRLLGYCLSGSVEEQILPILWGTGANGKSTLVNIVMEILGDDYAIRAPRDLLLARKRDSHPTVAARLFGRRLAVCMETGDNDRLDEPMVKELTGSDPIPARRMREDYWDFPPTHKVFLVTNHKPAIRGTDAAIWRRPKLIPFTATFTDDRQDKALPAKLGAEYPGVLAWLVQGFRDWQAGGLQEPEEVKVATAEYRGAQDLIGTFIAERCVIGGSDYRIRASDLYGAFTSWCGAAGEERPPSRDKFGDALTRKPGVERRNSNGTWYIGIALSKDNHAGEAAF